MSKAFDTFNHNILIQKLEHYGIRGVTKLWFQDHLTNRKQIVKYSQVRSKEMLIENGLPQGSIPGPILFLLYVNDIETCSQLLSFVLFADDTNIFYSNKCLKTVNEVIQAEINKVSEWLNVNKLSLNITKTKFIVFRSSNKKPKYDVKITMNNKSIEQVRKTNFLGIIIDEYLTWNDHIAKVANRIIRASSIAAKVRHFLNRNAIKLIYYALVYSYLIYGNLIWGNTYKTRIQKIMNIQKKNVRLMTYKSYSEHTEPIFKNLNLLDIFKMNDFLTATLMFRYHSLKNLPEEFDHFFVANNHIHQNNTRNSFKLHKRYKRTNYVKHTLANKGVDVWNLLESKLKKCKFLQFFQKANKKPFFAKSNIKFRFFYKAFNNSIALLYKLKQVTVYLYCNYLCLTVLLFFFFYKQHMNRL